MGSLLNAIPSSWLVAGIAGLVPTILFASSVELPKFALSLGGIMLAHQTFGMIQAGIQNAIMLLLSWDQVKPVYKAASEPVAAPGVIPKEHSPLTTDGAVSPEPLLLARELTYRYPLSQRAVLQNCSLEVFEGDHIILEGVSGGGKTTLGALLAGLRRQETGLLLLRGYDRNSLGEEVWRRRVVMAPQFHENHIFNETFAFNLLMGRRWPPEAEDMAVAGEICEELGLSDLLARMPSGWQQLVGENGWQLSHGERSRVFIARALLQKADMVIMDESFGALDPENLYFALDCARRRAATLLVIAHP
jgi:ATP-binding cassette subfamily B protein